jgi:hypothetical protein
MRAKLLTIRHKKKGTIERVPEHEARARAKRGQWVIVPKHVFKHQQ